MWKKALWVYLGLYVLGVIGVAIYSIVKDLNAGGIQISTYILYLIFFVPTIVVVFHLKEKKVSIIFTILGLLIVALPIVAILNFNALDLATIGKVLLFVPMVVALVYFGYERLFHK